MRSVAEQLPKANRWKAFVDYMVAKITRPLPPWLPPDPPCIDWVTAVFRFIRPILKEDLARQGIDLHTPLRSNMLERLRSN